MMKRVILTLTLIFSLFMSISAFAADYSISDPYWDIGDKVYVGWEKGEDKSQYKLQVFKGSKKVSSNISTGSDRYDITRIVVEHGSGKYTFKVYPSKGGKDLTVEASETIDSETISDLKKKNNITKSNNSGSSSNKGNKSSTGSTNSGGPGVAGNTGWYQTGTGWHYKKADGLNSTGWELVNNKWYYFDANAIMQTGWIEYNGFKYYLKPGDGDMATAAWELIDNKWYMFDESGHLKKGWVEYNGAWYYLTDNGEMAVNTTIDGFNINHDGIWVQ